MPVESVILQIFAGLLLIMVGWLFKIVSAIHRRTEGLEDVPSQVQDMHDWQKPDQGGRQRWKNDPEQHHQLVEKLDDVLESLRDLVAELRVRNSRG